MHVVFKAGKYLFALSIVAFGIIQFGVQDFMKGFLPMPENLPARIFFLNFISTLFIVGGISMCIRRTMHRAALLTGILFFILFIYPHLITLLSDIRNPNPWTVSAEDLSLASGAIIISGYALNPTGKSVLARYGRIFFAVSLIVFAVQHFMYADFIGTLVPAWIPFKLFWAYFIGVAFSLASISLLTNIKTRLASSLLGFMFLFWVIFLHLPRVAAATHIEPEKTSMFIALAMCGIFFTIASEREK
ncbi:MAG TPA: hypothetical protein VHT72_07340 [Puia sp.]|nr:hypothetical protein [Puia sp.]